MEQTQKGQEMKMGFEPDRNRVVRVPNSRKCSAVIGGINYNFDSLFEMRWAKYLQFLKEHGQIQGWKFHPVRWDFWRFNYRNKPHEYTPDFQVTEMDGAEIFQETKGYIETRDISRMRRAAKHYDAVFDLIVQRMPKRGRRSEIIAKAGGYNFVRRVVDGGAVLREVKNLIQ